MLLVQQQLSDTLARDDDGGGGGAISDHLRNHLHLTNCIHLKNHMHHHSPVWAAADRSLRRNLIVLQRSRSLRDPSTSPPSWHSPSVTGPSAAKRVDRDGGVRGGRRSLGSELQMRSSWASPRSSVVDQTNRTTAGGGGGSLLGAAADHSGCCGATVSGMTSKEEEHSSRKNDEHEYRHLQRDRRTKQQERRSHISQGGGGTYVHNTHHLKTLKEELQKHATTFKDLGKTAARHAHNHPNRKTHIGVQDPAAYDDAPQASTSHANHNGARRPKRQKFRGVRAAVRGSAETGITGIHRDFPAAASNSLAPAAMHTNYHLGGEDADDNLSRDQRHVCGIPWNWSRIHHRGKTILDIAGRSLSCGRSESRLMKDRNSVPHNQRNDNLELQALSDPCSGSSAKSDSDALPLLNEPGESYRTHIPLLDDDYMGELEIFASNDQDSDQGFEARLGNRENGMSNHSRHQTLMQKYMPKTFEDVVGQNLVIQALSNAILRRKVGLVYIFHGPQGTGKTSCARLFAKALNCQSQDSSRPCGSCAPCLSQTMGRSRNVIELGPAGTFDFDSIMEYLDNLALLSYSSTYMVFIVDECDTLPLNSWNSISKVIDHAPRRVVFLLVSTTIDRLPHSITSKCQKFFFPKLKDADIVLKLQQIAVREGLEIENDTLKLIASRSDGSLRDAEMTLDQLSLLGQKISLALVQELVGMVSDEKLVDLLDFALSGDTVNTVKRLRDITEAGVEPLALMSQLATVITDILAGRYVFSRERQQRKFFRHSKLSKDNMEKLRLALKTLSDAEKQLRLSNEKLTWLTAALLQFAPDQLYLLPSSSGGSSLCHSPMLLSTEKDRRKNNGEHNMLTEAKQMTVASDAMKTYMDVRKIWKSVIEKIQINALKQFIQEEGKLVSVSFGAGVEPKDQQENQD